MASEERLAQRILPPIFTPYTYRKQFGDLCKFRYRYEPVNMQITVHASKNTLNRTTAVSWHIFKRPVHINYNLKEYLTQKYFLCLLVI